MSVRKWLADQQERVSAKQEEMKAKHAAVHANQAAMQAKHAAAQAKAMAPLRAAKAATRAERIAEATGEDGKIRTASVVWDGRTLVLHGPEVSENRRNAKMTGSEPPTYGGRVGSSLKPADVLRRLKRGETVLIPAKQIARVAHRRGVVEVFTVNGREYSFDAPTGLVDALMVARNGDALDRQIALAR